MKMVFKEFRRRAMAEKMGEMPMLSRWWRVEHRGRGLFKHGIGATGTFMILIFIGWRRKWWTSLSDCPLSAAFDPSEADLGEGIAAPPDSDEAEIDQGEADDPNEAQDEQEEGAEEEAAPVARLTLAQGREQMRATRKKYASDMRFAIHLLSSSLRRRIFVGMCELPTTTMAIFNEWLTDLKTKRGSQTIFRGLHTGELLSMLKDQMEMYFSQELANRVGCTVFPRSGKQRRDDKIIAAALWAQTVFASSEMLVTLLHYVHMPPHSFVALGDDDDDEAIQAALREAAKTSEAKTNLQSHAAKQEAAEKSSTVSGTRSINSVVNF